MMTVLTQRTLKYSLQALNRLPGSRRLPTVDYFAYGANMDASLLQKNSIFPSSNQVAYLPNFDIEIAAACEWKGKGYASIYPSPGQAVYGIAYRLTILELVILDIIEWVPFKFYRREQQLAIDLNGGYIKVWVYVACAPQGKLATSLGYHKILLRAAEDAGFPKTYIKKLMSLPTSSCFSIDHGFRLSNATKRRPFEKRLHHAYRLHDTWREKLCQKLP